MDKAIEQKRPVALSSIWLKAAVLGGIWASVEIIIGSFFHNLRIPFAGTILAANGTILMIAFYQMWPEKGLIWRAGLITALMKSVSPSAVILGPMIGILSEALIVEIFIRFFGNNLLSLSVAGSLSVASALIHKFASLIILYGLNIVRLYVDIYKWLAKQINVENPDPWLLLIVVSVFYLLLGFIAAIIGFKVGKGAYTNSYDKQGFTPKNSAVNKVYSLDPDQSFSVFLFYLHLIMIPLGLIILNYFKLHFGILFIAIYTTFCITYYKRSLRRLKKPAFWGQLIILTFLASVFWNGFRSEGSLFETEGLIIGLEMNLRAFFVVIAFSSFGVELRNPVIRDYLSSRGFDKIYTALGLSFTALPVIIEAMPKPGIILRQPIQSFSMMMVHAQEWLEVFKMGNSSDDLPSSDELKMNY